MVEPKKSDQSGWLPDYLIAVPSSQDGVGRLSGTPTTALTGTNFFAESHGTNRVG
jgi:hypothetical protein